MTDTPSLDLRPVHPDRDPEVDSWYATYLAADVAGRPWAMPYRLAEVRADLQAVEAGRWRQAWSGLVDGQVVVAGSIETSLSDNLDAASLHVHTDPSRRRRGYGSAMLSHLEQLADLRGRRVLHTESAWPIEAGVSRTEEDQRFLTRRGYRLGLVSIQRALSLPVGDDRLSRMAAQAAAHHGDYTIHSWVGSVPEGDATEMARLMASLPVEAPTGDLHRETGSSDVEDLRAGERTLTAQGRTKYTSIARDARGTIAGYTELVVSQHEEAQAFQWDTLVRREDRGHRLGMALKVTNLRRLQSERPEIQRVITTNAEVNRAMIVVNEALGFRGVECLGEFQKHI